jgi:amino-acid N-acetyltransferase
MHNYSDFTARTETRPAVLPDVDELHAILEPYAQAGVLLPRSLAELSENVRDFRCCRAKRLYGGLWRSASLRQAPRRVSLAGRGFSKPTTGVGRALVEALLGEAGRHGVTCVCLFTRTPDFFSRLGFEIARREDSPDKIYKDCLGCPRLAACDEIAMFQGKLPPNSNGRRDPRMVITVVERKP